MRVLVTGGSGFFGMVLKKHLAESGHDYVNFDRIADSADVAAGRMAEADLLNREALETTFRTLGPFEAVCHLGAELAHDTGDLDELWKSNVEGTRNVADAGRAHGIKKLIFTSTNCLWGKSLNRPVKEDDIPQPTEIYGRSKLAAEELLKEYRSSFAVIIFRSPTIISPGRVGLLGILFDFIKENRRIPVVGRGDKAYQFIDAEDYARAIEMALERSDSDLFNIGSDHAVSLEKSYRYVIEKANSSSRIYHLPCFPTLQLMKLCHALKLSPLGPYHYGMIAEEFVFDTAHIQKSLGWRATKQNGEILYSAYDHYSRSKGEVKAAGPVSAHRKSSRQGIIRLLRWIS